MAADDDVPLGDAARHYERQFGDKIRQVQKHGARPPAGNRPAGAGAGRGGAVAVVILAVIVVRVLVGIGSRSSRPSPSYTFTPPPAPQIDFEQQRKVFEELAKLEQFQRDADQRQPGWQPAAPGPGEGGQEPSYRFEEGDVPLPEGLCYRMVQEAREAAAFNPGKRVRACLGAAAWDRVRRAAKGEDLQAAEVEGLRAALNDLLDRRDFFSPAYFAGVNLPADARDLARHTGAGLNLTGAEVRKLNRLALEAAYPAQIVPARQRGQANVGPRWGARLDLREAQRKYEPARP